MKQPVRWNAYKSMFKKQTALATENSFEQYCQKNDIEYLKLDLQKNEAARKKYLTKPTKKCPDFWCKKEGKEIFVEIKTLTNFTNQKRQTIIDARIKKIRANKLYGGFISEPFDPNIELEIPFTTYLKDASNKFKNINTTFRHPRILFIDGIKIPGVSFSMNSIFHGTHPSFTRNGVGKLIKTKHSLFDKTGSNVSALIYWNEDENCFFGLENYNAQISFPDDYFKNFFDKTKILS